MENIKKFKMRRLFVGLLTLSLVFTSCEDFLEEYSTIGLSADKLIDINAMNSLNAGAYSNLRNMTSYEHMQSTTLVRDVLIRRSANWQPWFTWTDAGMPQMFNRYTIAYQAFNKINTVLNAGVDDMYGTAAEKASAKGDAYFIRAFCYFHLNNWFSNPSTGKSVPLVTTVMGTTDRVTQATPAEIMAQVEADIEAARTNLAISGGITSYSAATAMAAKIYFYHGKYDLAYDRANEVITSGNFALEQNVAEIYTKGNTSAEVIFSVITNRSEDTFGSATIGFQNYQADNENGITSLNPNGVLGKLRAADPSDKRFTDLITEKDGLVYTDGKYPNNNVDYIGIRLAEMYLTRAESNIMVNNTVSAQDVSDVNAVQNRAGASDVVSGTPGKSAMLEIIFNERSKELYNETGDRFFNTRRLQKSIVNESGNGFIPFSDYSIKLYNLIPQTEIQIHNLN